MTLGHRDAFFDIESVNDVIEVWLNEQHPVHEHLIDVVTTERDDESLEELSERLRKAAFHVSNAVGGVGTKRRQGAIWKQGCIRGCQNGLGTGGTEISRSH